MKRHLGMPAGILYLAWASTVGAHHGHFYDECKSVTIEGHVEQVEWKNPHNLFTLRLDDGTAYTVDWINLTRLTSAGIIGDAKHAVASGARVVVTGYRIRSAAELRKVAPKFKGDVNVNTVEARALRRVDGSFSWPPNPSTYTPACNGK
jgi:hypothetical protein